MENIGVELSYSASNAHHLLFICLFDGTMEGFRAAWLVDPKSQVYLTLAINSRADLLTFEDALGLSDFPFDD